MRLSCFVSSMIESATLGSMIFNSDAMYVWVRSSEEEPMAKERNLANSFGVRSEPSAMLEGIEIAARCIWSLSPKSLQCSSTR